MPNTVKTETARHLEAFEYYYSLGSKRSHALVASKFGVRATTVARWSMSFNWQGRIVERDRDNGQRITEKNNSAIVNTKADYRRDIRLALQPVKAAINKAIVKNEETGQLEVRIPIAEAKDLSSVIGAFDRLVKLDLLLMGESDSSQEIVLKLPKEWKDDL